MKLEFTEDQLAVQRMAREFADEQVAPRAKDLDEKGEYPADLVAKLGELGLMGVAIPPEYGGSGFDYVTYVLAMEEISRACAGTGVIMSVNNSLVCDPLYKYGTDAQKKDILAPLAAGKQLGCFGLTEPGAGSDPAAMRTTVRQVGDELLLSGEKIFITNAPNADWAIIFATEDKELRHKGVSAVLLPLKNHPGVSVGPKEIKMGIRASHSSSICMEEVKLPVSHRLGDRGMGFKVAMTTLDAGRIGIASQALGIAAAALNESLAYAKERETFGKPIAQHQAVAFMLADMGTELDAARLLTLRAAFLKDHKRPFSKESAMAKVFAAEMCMRLTTKAIQVHGGYGYLKEYAVERHFRDAKITDIYEGTSEIQRLVISSHLLKG
ncbi:MAG: acyl-CoA dehydrogenase family protein [Deltaproteobacteria bacterium]|nr:acyl-CoA dehydrogenase family protein [Deltaproteobacteria bacterium]